MGAPHRGRRERTCIAADHDARPRRLARPRGAALLEADVEAARDVRPHTRRAGDPGQLLRRHAGRARARGRSDPHARRRRDACYSSPPRTTAGTRWPTASHASRRASGVATTTWLALAPSSARSSTPPRRSTPASSPRRPTTSTGTTRCGCCSKSARASRPTHSPGWRPTSASRDQRRWRRRSSPA